jgi:hypothetical protein
MNAVVDLKQMTVSDKLRLMEEIWSDLSRDERELVSPEWHGKVLEERERKLASGEDAFVDWAVAKEQLRSRRA